VRYASEGTARSLFASADVDALKRLHPEIARLKTFSEGDRVIVSEPFADLPGAWQEIPQATAVCVLPGGALEQRPFVPRVEAPPPVAGSTATATTTTA
jgi:glutamine amidotransferase